MTKNTLETLAVDLLSTTTQRAELLDALFVMQALGFTKNMTLAEQKMKKKVPEKFFTLFESLLSEISSPLDLTKRITQLQTFLNKLPVAKITLSYSPTQEQLEQLSAKIRTFFDKSTLIEYVTDQETVLAVNIDFQGKTYQKKLEMIE